MRLPRRGGRTVPRRSHRLASALAVLASLAPLSTQAIDFNPVPSPNLDFSNLGRIGIAGDFQGISLYEYEGQGGRQRSSNGSESLLAMLPNGALGTIVSTDASIRAMCSFTLSNGEMQGVVIGGNFTSLDGIESTAIALFNPNTTEITPLDGLKGQVNALLCDQKRDTVYVGGNFQGANSTNAIAWYGTEGWTNLPFAGFNGPVEAITKAADGHIIFGGSFTGLGNASAPSEPDGQTINLSTANISAENSASIDGFSDPKNIVCSSGEDAAGSTWLVEDSSPGTWDADFAFGFEPTKLRLWNTHHDGRGTKIFRFIALPIDGIMNLTYVDPATGQTASCSSECPLSSDTSIDYQDFHFVNRVGMNRFQIAISDWYGQGAGLAGVALFEDNIFTYAIDSFNEPECRSIDFPSTATSTGPWSVSPSHESNSKYLVANFTEASAAASASVVFSPNIRESGNYSVNMYTPGCKPDGTCATRGRVNITGSMSSTSSDGEFSTTLFQTNNYDKYDQIYFGYIEKTSDAFTPTITLAPLDGQDLDPLTVVAQRVGFTFINSTGGLNGLFEFDPDLAVVNASSFQDSAIDQLGASFSQESAVKSLLTVDGVTYAGGNFTSDDNVNIVAIDGSDNVKPLDGGLNGQVLDMYAHKKNIYVGGSFTNTLANGANGLEHVAVYNIDKNSWAALGAGVDGRVEYIVPMRINTTADELETVITFSGQFTQCRAFGDNAAAAADGFAVWVPSQSNWLQNLDSSVPSYTGLLTAAILDVAGGESIFAGSISSAQMSANGAATLDNKGLGQFPVDIEAKQPSSSSSASVRRRDVLSTSQLSGVETGIFYDNNGKNTTVLAGHFAARSSNGTTVNNLVLINGKDDDSITGLGSGVADNSTFLTLDVYEGTLYAGGMVSGTINGNQVNGLVAYDMEAGSFASQPPSVSGANGTVTSISVRPKNHEIYVAGSFTKAGALDCPGVCMYDAKQQQWMRPGSQIQGDVYYLMWASHSKLVAGGNMKGNDSQAVALAVYDTKKDAWKAYPGADSLPGPVHVITPASKKRDQIWVAGASSKDGSIFLMKYDGDKWIKAPHSLPADTDVRSLQVFTLTKNHDKTDILDKNQVLMITGSIDIPDFGTASAALYNGTAFQPYLLTTGSDKSSVVRIFSQKDNFFSSNEHHMPLVFVVLIGLAIALGLILLLVVGGIVLDRYRKKREGYTPAPTSMYDRGSGIRRIPPRELLQSLGKGRPGAPHV